VDLVGAVRGRDSGDPERCDVGPPAPSLSQHTAVEHHARTLTREFPP